MKHYSIALLSVALGAFISCAKADGPINLGNGAFGANRRVETPAQRFIAVEGTFAEPTITVPANNAARSKPTFYFGSRAGNDRVDAGIQFEVAQPRLNIDPGWAIFFDSNVQERAGLRFGQAPPPGQPDQRGEPGWTSVRPNGARVRIPQGQLGTTTLSYQVLLNGAVQLAVQSAGGLNLTAYADPVGSGNNADVPAFDTQNQQITNAALEAMAVRRVVGITQAGTTRRPVAYDGSTSIGNLFSEPRIGQATIANNNPILVNGEMRVTWRTRQGDNVEVWDAVNQPSTGFAPNASDRTGAWVIDFSYPRSAATPNYRAATVPARYNRENVDIRMLRGARVRQRRAARRGRGIRN